MLYSVRSERLLMGEIDYSMLFRWFVDTNLDEPVWDVTAGTKYSAAKTGLEPGVLGSPWGRESKKEA